MPIHLLFISVGILGAITLLGLRLLVTGCARRSVPEIALATFFLVGGTLAFGLDLAAREMLSDSLEWQARLRTGSNLAIRVPAVAIALFTWRVFRPSERWAAWMFAMIAGIQLTLNLSQLVNGPVPSGSVAFWIGILATVITLAWAMAESFARYHAALRRMALGLADAVVTNRFLLWSVWSGTAMMIVVGKVSSTLLFDVDAPFTPLRAAVTVWQSSMGLVCVMTMALTFYPPAAYKHWIESRSATRLAAN